MLGSLLDSLLGLLGDVAEETGQGPLALEVAGSLGLLHAVLVVDVVHVVGLDGGGALGCVLL